MERAAKQPNKAFSFARLDAFEITKSALALNYFTNINLDLHSKKESHTKNL